MWRNIDPARKEYVHYSVMSKTKNVDGMSALRDMFPSGEDINSLNFVLFSTSGVHGTYTTIEDVEKLIGDEYEDDDITMDVTFLIVHPRLVALRFGNCTPKTKDDIEYLKKLRSASHEVVKSIGLP